MAVYVNIKENSQKFHVAIIFGPKLYTLSIFTVTRESKNYNSYFHANKKKAMTATPSAFAIYLN